jgi:hypothetical protein
LCLRQLGMLADFARIERLMNNGRPLTFRMRQGFTERLDQIIAVSARRQSFLAAVLIASASAAFARFWSGIISVLPFFAYTNRA